VTIVAKIASWLFPANVAAGVRRVVEGECRIRLRTSGSQLSAGFFPFDEKGLKIRSRSIDGSGQSGRARSDDDHVSHDG